MSSRSRCRAGGSRAGGSRAGAVCGSVSSRCERSLPACPSTRASTAPCLQHHAPPPLLQRGKLQMEQLFREVVPQGQRLGTKARALCARVQACPRQPWAPDMHGSASDLRLDPLMPSSPAPLCLPLFPRPCVLAAVCVPTGQPNGPFHATYGGCGRRAAHHHLLRLQARGRFLLAEAKCTAGCDATPTAHGLLPGPPLLVCLPGSGRRWRLG